MSRQGVVMLNRREFIRGSLATGLFLGSSTLIGGCSGVTRRNVSPLALSQDAEMPLDRTGRMILQLASLAPSGHNSQPWRVKIESRDRWAIEADPARRLPCVDPHNRELLLSLGAFIENLTVAAANMGRPADVRVIAGDYHDREVAQVALNTNAPTDYPLRRLELRRTVRRGHLPKALSGADVKALSSQLQPGQLVYFPRGSGHAACIREAVVESYRVQAERDDAQQELVEWLRLRDQDVRQHRDGLSTEGMEITGLKGWFVRQFIAPEDFMQASYRRQGIDLIGSLAGQGGGWMVITSHGQTAADLVDTGRRFQRMALLARERNIAIHPMTQVLEEPSGIDLIANQHGTAIIPQFVLRVGYIDRYPEPVSLRRPVDWFVHAEPE